MTAAGFFQAYLPAFVFWTGLGLSCLGLLLLTHLVSGAWARAVRPWARAGALTLPWMALAFLVLLPGLEALYPWARGERLGHGKEAYLNVPFFLARSAAYFAAWTALALRPERWTPGGMVLYFLTLSFAAVDWTMSLEPHWYSTIYGLLAMIGHVLGALCLCVLGLAVRRRHEPQVLHDLGNLLLAFLLLWAYMAFSQYLIIWSGNLPEETPWYLARSRGGWQVLAWILGLLHFAAPFAALLLRELKRDARALAALAGAVLALRAVDLYWTVAPAFSPGRLRLSWLDPAAFAGLGALWLGLFLRRAR